MSKDVEKIQKAIEKLRADRAAYIQRTKDEQRRQAAQIIVAAGAPADVPISISEKLSLDTLNTIEILYNEPLGSLKERERQLVNAEKSERLKESGPIVVKMTAKVEALRFELETKEAELAGFKAEIKDIENHLRYRDDPNRAIFYNRCASLLFDSRVNSFAKKSHLDYISNY
jgi:hypothetical protein